MVQWLKLHVPSAGGPGSIPGQGIRPHLPHQRSKIPRAVTKTWHGQINIKKKRTTDCKLRGVNWGSGGEQGSRLPAVLRPQPRASCPEVPTSEHPRGHGAPSIRWLTHSSPKSSSVQTEHSGKRTPLCGTLSRPASCDPERKSDLTALLLLLFLSLV